MTKKRQLVILGNGFDIACGLKTTYHQFFESRFNMQIKSEPMKKFIEKVANDKVNFKNGTIINKFTNYFKEKGITFPNPEKHVKNKLNRWDIIFLVAANLMNDSTELNWTSVEDIIHRTVFTLFSDPKDEKDNYFLAEEFKSEQDHDGEKTRNEFINIIHGCFPNNQNHSEALKDLNRFEETFSDYVQEEVINTNYQKKAKKLLSKIIKKDDKEDSKIMHEVDVVSFNYSLDRRFIKALNNQNIQVNNWKNIHGIANWNNSKAKKEIEPGLNYALPRPIFGSDLNGLNLNDEKTYFTKEYRVFKQNIVGNLMKDVDQVIIFGHSLNKADKNYFKTYFEYYKIFDEPEKLTVYYYDEKSRKCLERGLDQIFEAYKNKKVDWSKVLRKSNDL